MNLEATVNKTIEYIAEASRTGAALIAFPETWIPGYPWHIWLGAPAWSIGRGFVQRYFDNSLSYDSPLAQKLADAAREHGITVVLGLSERDGGSLYIAQWIIGSDGETIGKRRKLRPTHVERTVYGEGDGSDLAVHDCKRLGRIGVAKNAADPAGHSSRPDVTRLLLNTKPLRRVEYFSLPADMSSSPAEVNAPYLSASVKTY